MYVLGYVLGYVVEMRNEKKRIMVNGKTQLNLFIMQLAIQQATNLFRSNIAYWQQQLARDKTRTVYTEHWISSMCIDFENTFQEELIRLGENRYKFHCQFNLCGCVQIGISLNTGTGNSKSMKICAYCHNCH